MRDLHALDAYRRSDVERRLTGGHNGDGGTGKPVPRPPAIMVA